MRPNNSEAGGFEKSGRAPALAGSARCVRSSLAASTALVARAAPSVNEVCASAGETSAAIKSKALIAATQASLVLRQARWLPLFRSGKGITESRQILLRLVIVGRFLNLSKLVENERSVFGKKVQNPGVARVAQRCANETRIRGAQPLRHCHQGSIDHFLAADTRLVEALFADRCAQFRR